MKNLSKLWLILAIILLTLSTVACKTLVAVDEGNEITVPVLSERLIGKPVLEKIPFVDSSAMSDTSISQVSAAFTAYNNNLVKVLTYAKELEEYNTTLRDYYEEVISILTPGGEE